MKIRALARALGTGFIAAGFAVLFTTIGFTEPGPATVATPEPSSTPKFERGGPITLGVTGNLIAGQQLVNDGSGTGQSSTTSSAGGLIDIARRTGSTSADLLLPASLSGRGTNIGQLSAEFDTSYASYLFGPQQIGALGLLAAGSTTRGSSLIVPRSHGDLTLFGGLASGEPSFFVRGARLRVTGRRGYGALALYDAKAKGGGGVDGIIAGLASRPGRVSGQLEAGVSFAHGLDGPNEVAPIVSGTGFGLYGRLDAGSSRTYSSLILRDLTPTYVSLNGSSRAESYAGVTYRSSVGRVSYTAGIEDDRSGSDSSIADVRRESFSANKPVGQLNISINAVNQQTQFIGDRQWSGNLTTAFTFPIHNLNVGASIDLVRSTDQGAGPTAGASYQLALARTFGLITLQASGQSSQNTGDVGIDRSRVFTVGASTIRGKTGVTLSTQFSNQETVGSRLSIVAPTLSITRRISNALYATINTALQFRRDALNPDSNGHTAQISFSLGAPFSFGNGVVSGRADPRLPGTINGTVQTDATGPGSFTQSSAFGSGAANISVILDNQQIVRTDLQGRFSFRFVKPGKHVITIDPSSLPRGTQPAVPLTTVVVGGGQIAQIVLSIGAYGAIYGSISVAEHGQRVPVSNVTVILDSGLKVITDNDGNFAFGGLLPGKHTVAIVPETFPATFATDGKNAQSVNVSTGDVARIDFSGSPLGSITGKLTYDHDQPTPGKGVENAYVVANPGDRAVITDADGVYLLDNVPAGKYTLSVDDETLADGLGVSSDHEVPVTLAPGAAVSGIDFTIGTAEKGIVFTFKGNETNIVTARALERSVPPGGTVVLSAKTTQAATRVVAHLGDITAPLVFRPKTHDWLGSIRVPAGPARITTPIEIDAEGKTSGTASVDVTIDPNLPIVTLSLTPARPARGQYVHVRAHFFTDVKAGDKIVWQDASVTVLPAPRSGRFFEFDVRIGAIPYRGVLTGPGIDLPITLVR